MLARVRFGERDADLHRSAGVDGVRVGKELAPERHACDEVFIDKAELALGTDGAMRSL